MANAFLLPSIIAFISFLSYRIFFHKTSPNLPLPLPPGPKPLPIVGNVLDLPPKGPPEFQFWLKHKDLYGPISSLTVMGQPIIIIHDLQAVTEIMATKAALTSGRPSCEFADIMCGCRKFPGSLPYNDTFKLHRRLMHQQFGTKPVVARYNEVIEVEMRRLLLRILKDPEQMNQHFMTATGAVILRITYGYSIKPNGVDPLVDLVERMISNMTLAFTPGAWMVDFFPALKYLPDFFPGTKFKETARRWRKVNDAVANIPYAFVQQKMSSCRHDASYVSTLLHQLGNGSVEKGSISSDDEEAVKWTAGALYGGASHTTASTMSFFILAMTMYPDVQRKAQHEIDQVIGPDRLPRLDDRQKLPYLNALLTEAFRWCPAGPMGLPHTADEDIIYNGYLIPKGAYLLPAVWWFTHDPQVHPDPERFEPERFLHPRNEPDARQNVFGYGRRICPGRLLADSSIFIAVTQILAAFDIRKAVDEHGVEIENKLVITPGVAVHPGKFSYQIVPRSAKYEELVRQVEREHPWQDSDADLLGSDITEVLAESQVDVKV